MAPNTKTYEQAVDKTIRERLSEYGVDNPSRRQLRRVKKVLVPNKGLVLGSYKQR